jgi:hypothetical protein
MRRLSTSCFRGKRGLLIVQASLVLLGAGLIALGIHRGELTEIMRKAVVICLECIGIG